MSRMNYESYTGEHTLSDTVLQVKRELEELFRSIEDDFNKALPFIIGRIQDYFKYTPDPKQVVEYCTPFIKSILHVLIHEISHVVVDNAIRGLDLSNLDRIFVSEIITRFIERRLSIELKEKLNLKYVIVESFEAQVKELSGYPELRGLKIKVEEYEKAYKEFWNGIRENRSIGELVKAILKLKHRNILTEERSSTPYGST